MDSRDLPAGFRYAGIGCGIKKAAGRKDLKLVVSDAPSVAAGVYTQNLVVAAPVIVCRQRTPSARVRGVVINSGNANACTGDQGMEDALAMTAAAATQIGCAADEVLVMSTGIIGHPLPMDRLRSGIAEAADQLRDGAAAFLDAADGILTTDQSRKTAHRSIPLPSGRTVRLAGMAKGAGMIGPNMAGPKGAGPKSATLLGLLLTDAPLAPDDAQQRLQQAADVSFNCISVEGHTSTNDSLVLLASGEAADDGQPLAGEDLQAFAQQLGELCVELAKQIPADGEGATHLIEIRIGGARDAAGARAIAKTIAESALVKTAIAGGDPNWGRIVSAAGYAGAAIELPKTTLKILGQTVFEAGQPVRFDAAAVSGQMRAAETVLLELTVGSGPGTARFWTSDLTVEYVRFNSEYST